MNCRVALTRLEVEGRAARHPDVGLVGMTDADLQIELEQ